jgi:hypothetical protein
MLSYVYNTVSNLLAPGISTHAEEAAEAEARNTEDAHAKQFDQKTMLQRALKVIFV